MNRTGANAKLRRPLLRLAFVAGLIFHGCAAPPVRTTDRDLARYAAAGRRAFDQGRYAAAAEAYRAALTRGHLLNDAVGIGDAAYNLAAALMELNRFEPARDYLRLARAEFAKTGDLAAQADALLLEAKATRALCGAAEAQPLVAQALALPVAAGQDARNALAYALKADMACDAGDTGGARAALSVARKWAERGAGDPVLLAELARADARLLATAGDQAQAAQQFTQAAALFGRAGRHRQMAEALGLAARAYEAADQWAPAGERYLAAARSRFAQGDLTPALKDVNAALACAQRSGREDVKQRAQVLLNEISDAVEKAKSTAAQPAAP